MTYQFTEKQVYVNEHSICYLEGGIASSAAPILFLHGWAVGTAPYQEFLNTLCQRYKIIAPVLPGFGKSSRSNLNWDYHEYANFILDFLNTFNLKKVHIIGHSLGGGIAATIAVLRPSIVQSIVLVDSTGVPVEPVTKVFLKRAIEMTAQGWQIKIPQIIQIFKGFSYNFLFRNQNTIQALLLSLKKDLKPLLPKIQSPCLLVWGANDLTTPLSAAQEFAQSITGSKLVVVDGVYHEWIIFFVEKVTSIIFEFIEEIEAGK